jgi:putative RNA 2'-phosphotransferase
VQIDHVTRAAARQATPVDTPGAAVLPLLRMDERTRTRHLETNPKGRFALSEDGTRIRASQGHSVEVELGYQPAVPPEVLYHGTVAAALAPIEEQGLLKMRRHHVHLSADVDTARAVGGRRGRPVVLRVRAGEMHRQGHTFYLSQNGVWLTDHVPPGFLERL